MTIQTILGKLLFVLILGTGAVVAAAQDCSTPAKVSEVAPGAFVRQGVQAPVFQAADVANIGFILGQRCVAVFDTGGSLKEGRDLRCAIKQLTSLPVCYIVMSHMHPDHILGAAALRDADTVVIGHANLPRAITMVGDYYLTRLEEFTGQRMAATDLLVPDRTVEVGQPLHLDLGQRPITLRAHATAHTNNDLSLYDENTQTLWAGDLVFLGHLPVVDGSSQGWLQVLQELGALPAQRLVPGHGSVRQDWPQASAPTRQYLERVRHELRTWIDQGNDMLSAQDAIAQSEREHWLLFDEYHKRNISKIFAELEWE
ncbi:MAG: quinoprotein relay system zinc metallohydrolase 2 [Candidatus Competibacteraceae bacterium]|nr:quinoprotein relay system zinc metallohydrolase 2 [Candidatus Competibacteraceae bacterium]MCB1804742.1 quinoprotein relay system zinc metallohydrolase 2 [Candidatus Competibacteraceae bacterium]MCB1814526.1 quinoprotein relay system zinc metallohydrolase 2 [Candidatus Competibacteraceae bacterium]